MPDVRATMPDDLTGISVLVTRPQAQAEGLAAHLRQRGAQAFVFPVLEIKEVPLGPEALNRIAELDRYDGVFCISAPAADIGVRLGADRWPQWPLHQTWYAVGPASGRPLQGWGLKLVVADAGSSSETLLALPELQKVEAQRFLILRGVGGRETLAEILRSRGAQVDYLEIYRRQPAANDLNVLDAFLQAPAPRVVTVTSGESLDQLITQAGPRAEALRQLPLVVVSGRLAEHARHRGFPTVQEANGASDEALASTLATIHSTSVPTRLT